MHCHPFELPWGSNATITPRVNYKSSTNNDDVMRGEEVQNFGLSKVVNQESLYVILPGTHAKYVVYIDGEITSFSTFMTGELFSLLSEFSILGKCLPEQVASIETFTKGVKAGSTSDNLIQELFSARTHRLFKKIEEE
jgi:2-dehydro-3-deoxygalactonokinase